MRVNCFTPALRAVHCTDLGSRMFVHYFVDYFVDCFLGFLVEVARVFEPADFFAAPFFGDLVINSMKGSASNAPSSSTVSGS